VRDQFSNGPRFPIHNVIGDVTKECLAAIADPSISGRRVARELDVIVVRRGNPDLLTFRSRHQSPLTPCSRGPSTAGSRGVS
jgi:hypothetical protein